MSNIEVSVTGSDSPLQESFGRPRGHPFTDFHASHSTNSGAPNSVVFWKDPSVLLTFTASQHYQHKYYCAPCLCFLSISHHCKKIQDSQAFPYSWNLMSFPHCLFCPLIPLELLKLSTVPLGTIKISLIIYLFCERSPALFL